MKRARSVGKPQPGRQKMRPKLPVVSEEMKAWAALLESELTTWPRVTARAMFGFRALYRGKRIFAVLPRTRAMGSESSLAFKLEKPGSRVVGRLKKDARISSMIMQASQWFVFEMESDGDLNDALDWLGRAYEGIG